VRFDEALRPFPVIAKHMPDDIPIGTHQRRVQVMQWRYSFCGECRNGDSRRRTRRLSSSS
jgi:hypothetical protein